MMFPGLTMLMTSAPDTLVTLTSALMLTAPQDMLMVTTTPLGPLMFVTTAPQRPPMSPMASTRPLMSSTVPT